MRLTKAQRAIRDRFDDLINRAWHGEKVVIARSEWVELARFMAFAEDPTRTWDDPWEPPHELKVGDTLILWED